MSAADYRSAFAWHGMSNTLSGSVGQIFVGVASTQPYSADNWKTLSRVWSDSQLSMGEDACITDRALLESVEVRESVLRSEDARQALIVSARGHGQSGRLEEAITPRSIPALPSCFILSTSR